MLLLFIWIFLHYEILQCAEFEPATGEFYGLTVSYRHYYYFNLSSTDTLFGSTPGTHQTDQMAPQYSDLTTPLSHNTNTHDNLPSIHTQDPGLTTPSKYTVTFINLAHTTNTTVPTPEGTSSSSTGVESPACTVPPPVTNNTETVLITLNTQVTVDPSVAEHTKKWLDKITSTKATPKLRVPKLIQVFTYDYSAEGFLVPTKSNQKSVRKNIFRHRTPAITRQGDIVPQISRRINPESEAENFWQDPTTKSEESSSDVKAGALHRTTTVTKQRLKPGLLLGKATIKNDSNTEDYDNDSDDDDELKKISSGSDESKKIMRIHDISPTKKKRWYSDRTKVQTEVMQTATPTGRIEFVRHTMFPILTTTTTTESYNNRNENHTEIYMIVFLIQLTRLVATKEKKAVHGVLKHADEIMRGFFKSKKLQCFPKSLEDVTRNVTKQLKKSETGEIQKQAAKLHDQLRRRSQLLSGEVNKIIEYAGSLYDDDEGKHLMKALDEFVEYPNTTLSGYWLCKNLINSFLRPYRRLKDTRQRQQLMDCIDKALKSRFASESWTQKDPSCKTTETPNQRKRQRRHRLHKRKRERKRHRTHRPLPVMTQGSAVEEDGTKNKSAAQCQAERQLVHLSQEHGDSYNQSAFSQLYISQLRV